MTVAPTASAYEVALEFIRLCDVTRTWHRAGIEPTLPLTHELNEARYHLDTLLGSDHWGSWTNAQWDDIVRKRLTAQDPRPLVDGL